MLARHRRHLSRAAFGLALLLALALPSLLSPARTAPRYTVTDLGVLPGDTVSGANAINSAGTVVGYSQTNGITVRQRACIFQNGKVIPIGTPPGAGDSAAAAINSRGEVTGYDNPQGKSHAFLCSGGKVNELGTVSGFDNSGGRAISDLGVVAGNSFYNTTPKGKSPQHAFLSHHRVMTDIGVLPGADISDVYGINAAGQIVGTCYFRARVRQVQFAPFVYDSRRRAMTSLPMPPFSTSGRAYAISDQGLIAGSVRDGNEMHAALWDHNRLTDLGTPSEYYSATAKSINNHGEAAGYCFREDSTFRQFLLRNAGSNNPWQRYLDRDNMAAFFYKDGHMQNLNELIPDGSDWILEQANGINDKGQIAGQGLHHGVERAFLLTPK